MELVGNQIRIIYLDEEYLIDKDKLKFILNKFDIDVDIEDINSVRNILVKYQLLDKVFLENLNKIW